MHVRSFLYGLASSLVLVGGVAAIAQGTNLDELVLATVNNESITRKQLVNRLLEYQGDDALQKMVNRSLVTQAAKKLSVTVTDAEVDAEVDKIKKNFKNEKDFLAVLQRSNLTERQHRDEVRFTLLMQRVVLKEQPVTDEDLQQYDVRMIIAPDKKTAEKWIGELGTTDFAQMASQRSLDPAGRESGGRMKPFLRVELLDVWRAINEQKIGKGAYTKAPVLLTDASWAIIKLENVIPASSASTVEKERMDTLVRRYRMDRWLNQAREQAKIAFPSTLQAALGK
jgi:foldase protein PrsA